MISDATDPVVAAALRLDDVQAEYDAALVYGRGMSDKARTLLATRLSLARRDLRAAIYGRTDSIDEVPTLRHMLPALEPVREDEE